MTPIFNKYAEVLEPTKKTEEDIRDHLVTKVTGRECFKKEDHRVE